MSYKVYTESKNGVDITPGKMYDYTPCWEEEPLVSGFIKDDTGVKLAILIKACAHLKGDNWEVIED